MDWRALSIGLVVSCAPGHSAPFSFELVLNQVPPSVIDVTSEDMSVVVERDDSGARVTATRTYDDYAAGQDGLVRLMIRRVNGVTVSEARPGVCALECVYEFCPAPSEVTDELLEFVPPFEFQTADHACIECRGGGKLSRSCP